MVERPSTHFAIPFFFLLLSLSPLAHCQLDYNFYDYTCRNLEMIVRYGVWEAISNDNRMAASLVRMHFHDCFVNGCDASVLLDDTNDFKGEKNALPNRNSLRGYEVIDKIKADVERYCPSVVSCTDILTLAARDSVVMAGGSFWAVPLGRRDGTTASDQEANQQLPSPMEPLGNITAKFTSKGLDMKDVVVLSGAHTIGLAQCSSFKHRLFNFKDSGKPDPTLDSSLLQNLQSTCPSSDTTTNKLAPLDSVSTNRFDNMYYKNLVSNSGLLESDQVLMGDPRTASMVYYYSMNSDMFKYDFGISMTKLSNVGVLTGQNGQIRKKCGSVN